MKRKAVIVFIVTVLLAFGFGVQAQSVSAGLPPQVNAGDARITRFGHATLTGKKEVRLNARTLRMDTIRIVEGVDWDTPKGECQRRLAARSRRASGSDFYDKDSNWWLDIYWYNFNYPSVSAKGEPVILSAMACMPDNDIFRVNNVVIGCHATITDNKSCPSMYNHGGSSLTDVSMMMNMASSGLVAAGISDEEYYNLVILPDYEGYGISKDVAHPYLYQELTARQSVDAVRYGIALYKTSPIVESIRHPFSSDWRTMSLGYSQGGSVAMAVQRFIEQNGLTDELQFAGSVCGDGPYDPMSTILYYVKDYLAGNSMKLAMVLPLIMKGMCDSNPYMQSHKENEYMSGFLDTGILDWLTEKELSTWDIPEKWAAQYAAGNYTDYLEKDGSAKLGKILNEEGYNYFKALYDAYKDDYTSAAGVPIPAQRGKLYDVHLALESNNLTGGWNPRHPIHLYHSDVDHVVPIENRMRATNVFTTNIVVEHNAGISLDHQDAGREFFMGTERRDAQYAVGTGSVHPDITYKPHANLHTGYVLVNGKQVEAEYVLNDGKLTLGSGYNACMSQYHAGIVVVPSEVTINGTAYPVTAINNFAFRLCDQVTHVMLGEGVSRIGRFAFVGCHSLQEVSLPSTLQTIGSGAFIELPNLTAVTCLAATPPVWEYNDVFCFHEGGISTTDVKSTSSVTLYVSNSHSESYQNATYSDAGLGWTTAQGWGTYFTDIRELADTDAQPYAAYADGTLTFYYDNRRDFHTETTFSVPATADSSTEWYESAVAQSITKVVFTPKFVYYHPTSTAYWFFNLTQLATIEGMEYLNTSETTTMAYMFAESMALPNIDLSHLNTAKVTDFTAMFQGCKALTTLDVSGFNTCAATKMGNMFQECKALTTLDVSGFVTDKVTDFSYMFHSCMNLTTLNMTNFDFSAIPAAIMPEGLISECSKLETFYIPTLMTDATGAFHGCTSLNDVYYYGTAPFTRWDDCNGSRVFKAGKATRFHVLSGTLASWQTQWGTANCTFVGDFATEDAPLNIYSADDWEKLREMVEAGHTGLCVNLMADLDITQVIDGTFTGTFDGRGHTLTIDINGHQGLFQELKNGTIKNLHVAGQLSGGVCIAALVGTTPTDSENLIENCRVSATVTSSPSATHNPHAAGFVGHGQDAKNTLRGCLFDGKLVANVSAPSGNNTYGGAFVGWFTTNTSNQQMTDCVDLGTYERMDTKALTIDDGGHVRTDLTTNCYHNHTDWSDGRRAYPLNYGFTTTNTAPVTLDFGTAAAEYDVSGITAYSVGYEYDGIFYSGINESVTLAVNAPSEYVLEAMPAPSGTSYSGALENMTVIHTNASVAETTISLRVSMNPLELADNAQNSDRIAPYVGFDDVSVMLTGRTLYRDGSWNTLCLPCDISSLTAAPFNGDARVVTLSSVAYSNGTLTLDFTDVDKIEAGKPYLVKWNTAGDPITDPTFLHTSVQASRPIAQWYNYTEGAAAGAAKTEFAFVGSFNPVQIEGATRNILYLGRGNKLYFPDGAMTINACRAFFMMDGLTAGDLQENAIELVFNGTEGTGISTFVRGRPAGTEWYTLAGRRVQGSPVRKGIYISNGKKIIVK